LDNVDNKVLVIESVIKSNIFLNYLKKLIIDILYENHVSFSSIKKEGYFYVIKLVKDNELVNAMDLLEKVSGISRIFIAQFFVVDYDVISQTVIQIGKKILLNDEKFSITIATSKENDKNKNKFLFFRQDLEFLIISELSNVSTGIKYVRNESEADKILFVLIGTNVAYISLLLKKGKEMMPFKFLKEKVICPVYNEYSFLSLIAILNNGFFPFPFIFYNNENQLIKILKSLDKIIKNYPIRQIDINLIKLDEQHYNTYSKFKTNDTFYRNRKTMGKLMFDEIILITLLQLKIDIDFICLPLLPFLHPLWFFKKNIHLSFKSGKIPLTPFLFNYDFQNTLKDFYTCDDSAIDEQSLDSIISFLDIAQEEFEITFEKFVKIFELPSKKEVMQFKLDVGKDDILDILDSV
jgi:hypothetical protein